ncbi:MAG: hypothetical protein HYU63_02795 [Armatimonadetes bacterium]|nr:hypothetical protein [Armatimonadota bacterium]
MDGKEFAKLIGLNDDYLNDPQAKKDVIDKSGDSYSVKSGKKKWQIFLYSKRRFEEDTIFRRLNGLGKIMLQCIECFPDTYNEYTKDKLRYKNELQKSMKELREKLQNKETLSAFISKAMFNAGEVNYLSIKHEGKFYVYDADSVVRILTENLVVENSQARNANQVSNQKVIFKIDKTYGEIEMRNDSKVHYREVKFWLNKKLIVNLLFEKIKKIFQYSDKVFVCGTAIKKFGRW